MSRINQISEVLHGVDTSVMETHAVVALCQESVPGCTISEIGAALREVADDHQEHAAELRSYWTARLGTPAAADGPDLVSYGSENIAAMMRAHEQRIRPGDRVGFYHDDAEEIVGTMVERSPTWWRARTPDGRDFDLDVNNDINWIEHCGAADDEVTRLRRLVQRYRDFVQEPEVIDEIEGRP